eukprot:TRINITY_DN8676_c0_g1_i6.p1 TRINITY_DN8676_c0_g1~~TRINITY_DN8676_c0_g1_i6.p1  ORF type:complete len:472 (-),score=84.64 TRINITY_DN8676_c0_g1_i6:722-2137(-)
MLALHVGESAISFREQLQIAYDQSGGGAQDKYSRFPIMYEGINYLQKMNYDTAFFGSTNLTKFFHITTKTDPFLISAATPYIIPRGASRRQLNKLKAERKMIELPISAPLLKRIKAVEPILLIEARAENTDTIVTKAQTEVLDSKKQEPRTSPKESKPILDASSEAAKLLKWYAAKLGEDYAKSFCPLEKLVEESQRGCNSIWLCYGSDKWDTKNASAIISGGRMEDKIFGLAVLNVGYVSQAKSIVRIVHVSSIKGEIGVLLKELTDYIWNNINCDEIRVELTHYMQGGRLLPFTSLKREFTSLNFRWKSLINVQEGRTDVLGLSRPETSPYANPEGLDCKKGVMAFRHAAVLSVRGESEETKAGERCEEAMSLCCYLEAVKELACGNEESKCELKLFSESEMPFKELVLDASSRILFTVSFYNECRNHFRLRQQKQQKTRAKLQTSSKTTSSIFALQPQTAQYSFRNRP